MWLALNLYYFEIVFIYCNLNYEGMICMIYNLIGCSVHFSLVRTRHSEISLSQIIWWAQQILDFERCAMDN